MHWLTVTLRSEATMLNILLYQRSKEVIPD